MSKFNARRICRIALLAAMYFLLNMVEIRTPGNLHITFDALPVVVGALLLGPVDAVLIAMFGELLKPDHQPLRHHRHHAAVADPPHAAGAY